MGKQSKRNKSKRGNKQQQHSKPVVSASSALSSAEEEKGGVSTIVSKIRHGDPRVRHAALVALSSTLFHSSSLSAAALQKQQQQQQGESAQLNKTVADVSDEMLLRALSERILDVDIPCATAATGCLSNYVSFYCIGDAEETPTQAEVASEVMVPILFQRIQRSLDKITSLEAQIESSIGETASTASSASAAGSSSSSTIEKIFAFHTEQWVLVSLSLQTLAGLIENFPSAVERVSAMSLSTLCTVLPLVNKSILLTKNSAGEGNGGCILDASSNASRAIHSLLDDNVAIIASIQPTLLTNIVTELTNTITDVHMPHMTRLHASGALVSLRKVLVVDEEIHSARGGDYEKVVAAVQTCTDETVIDLLSNLFESGDNNHDPKQLVVQMIELSNKCQTMKQDEMMESQIESDVNARKEPARMIARRQKEIKESKKAKTGNKDMTGDEKEVTIVEDKDGVENAEASEPQLDDVKDELDKVVQSWRELVGSYKLALELVANLCSGREEQDDDVEDGMYPDDDEQMWDSDDEAKLVSAANAASAMNSMEMTSSPTEQVTYASMASKHLLKRIISFFRRWVEFLSILKDDVPALVSEDVDELQSTCALCLGNMVACDLPSLNEPSLKKSVMVGGQETPVTDGLDLFWWELIATMSVGVSDGPKAHVTSVMLAFLRHQPKARTLVNSAVLDLLLALFAQQSNVDGGASNMQMKCNVISMLGSLCSEPHPSEVNARVCTALLEMLRAPLSSIRDESDTNSEKARQSFLIMHETLNVLMDMYGGDDSHDEVFDQNDVLGHFQRCLPGFKRQIKKTGGKSTTREELDTWNETALNCSRFIKYKK